MAKWVCGLRLLNQPHHTDNSQFNTKEFWTTFMLSSIRNVLHWTFYQCHDKC
uniref:Uncharacterized protein n=1 Tax=Rhizophora mucronata TaxID=61149 RepID=A0A2P2PF37_RHIMU